MDSEKPRKLADTRIYLGRMRMNLADPETIKWLKVSGITKVFCLFPLTRSQLYDKIEVQREGAKSLGEYYDVFGIDRNFVKKLRANGIAVSSLVRNPYRVRTYPSFAREAIKTRGNFLIQCFAGKHASAAYAMYYLAMATPLTFEQIKQKFRESGYDEVGINLVKDFFSNSKINIERVTAEKIVKMERAKNKMKKTLCRRRIRKNPR